MAQLIIILVLSLVMLSKALPRPEIQVYEIHKTKDRNFDVADQYFDPDGLREEDEVDSHTDNTKDLAVKLLQLLSTVKNDERTHRTGHGHAGHVGDLNRSIAVIVLPLGSNQPQATALGKLLRSPLRSQYEDIEDRTAPPRIRRPYDDDDY